MAKKGGKKKSRDASSSQGVELVIREQEHFKCKNLSYGSFDLLAQMDSKLDRADVRQLEESQLWGIVMMGSRLQFSPTLVHNALLWQVKTMKQHETWYALQGHLARFFLEEFCLITGLDCSVPPRGVIEGDDKEAVTAFFGREKVLVSDLEGIWKAERDSGAVMLTRKYKLALLIIVECILLVEYN